MARRDLLAGLLVTVVAVVGVLVYFVVGRAPEPRAPAAALVSPPSAPPTLIGPSERELRLEEGLRLCQAEIAELRAELARIEGLLGARTPIPPVTAREISPDGLEPGRELLPPAAAPAADPAHETVEDWLRRLLPDRYGQLSPAEIAQLTELDLGRAKFTDADLLRLADLPGLVHLGLSGTAITDEGIENLRGLPQLEALDLRGTQISGRALDYLSNVRLKALHLTDTQITGADLYRLPALSDLEKLKLNFLPLGDEAIDAIARFPTLRHLELDRTAITDSGLARLLALEPFLTRIELRNTRVTPQAIDELRGLYPGCEFVLE